MSKLYEKIGRRYKEIGEEFKGFPADGIWLVKDGTQNCIIRLDDVCDVPYDSLLYLKLANEFLSDSNNWNGKTIDEMIKAFALFIAERAKIIEDTK